MRWRQIRDWLLPRAPEQDEGFRQEVFSASHRGARVVVGVEAVVAIAGFAGFLPRPAAFGLLILAAATFGLVSVGRAYPHERLLALLSATIASVIAVRSILAGASMDYALGTAAFLVLAAVTALPLLPVQSLGMGSIVFVAGLDCGHVLFFAMLAVAATYISATLYAQRRAYYGLFMDTMRTAGQLREFESGAMRAESSATMVRMTAALAHELSSPIGALSSGIETLLSVSARQAQ